ncbi:MAG: hypothetical protein ACRDG4_05275 [Chloroflexota bacterium]
MGSAISADALGQIFRPARAHQGWTGTPVAATRYLAVGGGRIAYDDTGGAGSPVVGIPGMGDLCSEFRYLRPALIAAGYRQAGPAVILGNSFAAGHASNAAAPSSSANGSIPW